MTSAAIERPEDAVTQALANLGLTEEQPQPDPKVSDFKRKEDAGLLRPEPLLVENPHRYVIFPIQHQDVSRPLPDSASPCRCIARLCSP